MTLVASIVAGTYADRHSKNANIAVGFLLALAAAVAAAAVQICASAAIGVPWDQIAGTLG
jgi:hypothetical protein